MKRRLQTEEMPFAVPQLSEPSMKKESGGAGLLAEEGRREGKDGRMDERVDGQMNGGKDK